MTVTNYSTPTPFLQPLIEKFLNPLLCLASATSTARGFPKAPSLQVLFPTKIGTQKEPLSIQISQSVQLSLAIGIEIKVRRRHPSFSHININNPAFIHFPLVIAVSCFHHRSEHRRQHRQRSINLNFTLNSSIDQSKPKGKPAGHSGSGTEGWFVINPQGEVAQNSAIYN